ncbi:MAG: acetate--CoA ligase [Hadesarchaea archaeon]|nr:acetate--CoA ligase [Hadesarchaea archaeon]
MGGDGFYFRAPPEYYELWKQSVEDPEKFWAEIAEKSADDIHWFKRWDRAFLWEYPRFRWFIGGLTNTGYNCVDHKLRYKNRPAYIYENPERGISRTITYGQLFDLVKKYSAALRGSEVKKGDRVLLYMPNCIESAALLQACARIGAIPTCVFAGFSPKALADRIELTEPKLIFTQDFSIRRGKLIDLKNNIDSALESLPPQVVRQLKVVVGRVISEEEPQMTKGRDIWFEEFEERAAGQDDGFVQLEANEPLLIMCTSGTTAKPKPVVHVHGGFQIWSYWTAKWIYGIKPNDIVFNTSDIGWIVGQSYIIFAPLLAGCTSILFDGTPDYPKQDVWWEIMEKHNATLFWTSPTGARVLRRLGIEQVKRHNLSSIERVVCAGEVLNPEVWSWLHRDVFEGRVPVIDHMWQTEVPGAMFGYPYHPLPPIKPGSAGFPLPGVDPEIIDDRTGQACGPGKKGVLVLKRPVPGMTPTLWKDPERYTQEYWEAKPYAKGKYFTGDSAQIDGDGYIFFAGRADEVIKIAAHRIGTVEIESSLISHPAVAEAGVCGIPDELRGEVAVAFVVLKPGRSPSEELKGELITYVRKTMGPIVVFGGIGFVNMLPKTRSGKIMRRVMKKVWMGEELGDLSTIEEDASVDEIKDVISKLRKI